MPDTTIPIHQVGQIVEIAYLGNAAEHGGQSAGLRGTIGLSVPSIGMRADLEVEP
jgi:hypothetical protein